MGKKQESQPPLRIKKLKQLPNVNLNAFGTVSWFVWNGLMEQMNVTHNENGIMSSMFNAHDTHQNTE